MCIMDNVDYPAGHSMDTEWFAVDKDGNVALFDTGPEGVLPVQYNSEYYFFEFIKKYSEPVSKVLRNFFLCDEQVEDIANACSPDSLLEMVRRNKNEDILYFTGFFLLEEGYTYAHLDFENNVQDIGYEYDENIVFCLSEKRQLYYINDVWGLRNAFFRAVEKGKILSCVSTYEWKKNEDSESEDFCFQFGLFNYENVYARGPYKRELIPKYPLNINLLPSNTREEIPAYSNLSFNENEYIQPMEFGACKPYGLDSITRETEYDKVNQGYAKVVLSDNETEAYCKIASAYWIANKDVFTCNKCNKDTAWYFLNHTIANTDTDSPRVMVIAPHLIGINIWEYEKALNEQVIKKLGIQKNDFYLTACVKCYTSKTAPDNIELAERFKTCKHWLTTEIQLLEPFLIICLEEKTFSLLSEHFKLGTNSFNQNLISTLKVGNVTIPFLTTAKLSNPNENIENLSQQVKTILSEKKERKIDLKPQVLRQ